LVDFLQDEQAEGFFWVEESALARNRTVFAVAVSPCAKIVLRSTWIAKEVIHETVIPIRVLTHVLRVMGKSV